MSVFDSGGQTREELLKSAVWTIGQGIHITKTQGENKAQKQLINILPASLSGSSNPRVVLTDYDLIGESDSWNPETLDGGRVYIFGVGKYSVSITLLYREDKDGMIFEYWRVQTTENASVGDDSYHYAFVLAVKDKQSEMREVLHYKQQFFDSYEIEPGRLYRLPLDNAKLVDRIEGNNSAIRTYFVGTPLENIESVYEEGKYKIVSYNHEERQRENALYRARKEVKRLDSLAWWLPREGMPIYREKGARGLSKQLEKAYLDTDIEVDESAWKNGQGKVFTLEVEDKNTHYDVYLISRIEKEGEIYEYWLLDGRSLDKSLNIQHRLYVVAKVEAATEKRLHLEKSEKPITSYTIKSGSVIDLPEVNSVIGKKDD